MTTAGAQETSADVDDLVMLDALALSARQLELSHDEVIASLIKKMGEKP